MNYQIFERAKNYINNGKVVEAMEILEQLKTIEPNNFDVLFELGRAYLIIDNNINAISNLQKSIEFKRNDVNANILCSKALVNIKKYRCALHLLFKCKKNNVDNKDIDKEIVNIFKILGKYKLLNKYLTKYFNDYLFEFYKYLSSINLVKCSDKILLDIENIYWDMLSKNLVFFDIEKLVELYLFNKNIFLYRKKFIDFVSYKMLQDEKRKFNNILNRMEIFDKKICLKSKPQQLSIVLTSKCNIICKFCNCHKSKWEIPYNIKEEIIKLMPFLTSISWAGGEVFLYEYFSELFDCAKINSVRQEIVTNSMLLTHEWIDRIMSSDANLAISIRSFNKNKYGMLCKGASFDKLIENLEYIKSNKLKRHRNFELSMYILVTKYNFMELEELAKYATYYGFNIVRFIQLDNIENSSKSDNICDVNFEYYSDFMKIFKKAILLLNKSSINIFNELPIKIDNSKQNSINVNDNLQCELNIKNKKLFCEDPWSILSIVQDGNVKFNCFCLEQNSVGRVDNNTNLLDIWNSDKVKDFRTKIIMKQFNDICNSTCTKYHVNKRL